MQEQNFEKQVQNTLGELSLTPSAPVWQKVEKEIRQKKKRRRVIVFWLFALLLIGGGAFWGLYLTSDLTGEQTKPSLSVTSKPTQQPTTHTTQNPTIATTVTKENTAEVTLNTATQNNSIPVPNIHKETSTATVTEKASVKGKQLLAIHIPKTKTGKKQNQTSPTQKTIASKEKKERAENSPFTGTEETVVATTINSESVVEKNRSINQTNTGQPLDTASASVTVEQPVAQQEKTIPALDSTQGKKAQKKTAKWSWAAQAGYGISSLQEDFLSKAMAAPEVYSDPLTNSGFPAPPAQSFSSAPGIEKGAAFHIALSAKRHLNNRFAITTALQYSYFSTKNKVGQTVERDTVLRSVRMESVTLEKYFRAAQNGPVKEYTNQYHFVELPLGMEWQLHRRLPLHLQTGISLSYLVATNALVFDPNAGIYYKNNDQFRKTQLLFNSGLTYRVWKHKSYGVHVGPYLQYGITNLQKENTNRHLFSTGLKTQVSF